MYVPITTFNIGYPHERPWKRLLKYYSTTFEKCKGEFLSFGTVTAGDQPFLFSSAPKADPPP